MRAKRMHPSLWVALAFALAPCAVAQAQEGGAAAPRAPYEDGGLAGVGLVAGLKVGAGLGQVTSDFGASFVGELELGYTLPLPEPVGRDLQLFVSASYAGPSTQDSVSGEDERLPGGWSYEVTLQQLVVTPGLLYRIPIPSLGWLRPYVAAGARIYLTRTEVSGQAAGEPFGDHEETATDYGGYGALGGDLFLGPGSLLLEIQFGYAPVDGYVLRDTNAGSLNFALGYRIFL